MPTYEYKCKKCGHEFEEVQSMSADVLVDCPVCKTPNLVRVISRGGGMIFKGSGFYQTDYKNTTSEAKESKSKIITPPAEKKADPKPSSTPSPAKPKE